MPDIEQRLRACAGDIAYPPTPDIAGVAASRLRVQMPVTRMPGIRLGGAGGGPSAVTTPEAALPLPGVRTAGSSLPGQLMRLAAAIVAFVIVGGLMVLVFQIAGDPRERLGGAFEAETVVQERLYVVSGGRFTAYDAETSEELYWVSVAYRSETVFSPDGSRVYLASTDNRLFAIRAVDGVALWQGPVLEAVGYIGGGPPSLAISPDGSRLYVHNYRVGGGGTADQVPFWVQTIDAATGETSAESEPWRNDECAARLHASPDNARVFRVCWSGGLVTVVDLMTGERQGVVSIPGRNGIAASVQSPDGRNVYVVTPGPQISVLDTVTGEARLAHDAAQGEPLPVHRGLVALSADGTRLAVGIETVNHDNGLHDIGRVIVYDTATWRIVADLTLEPAITDPLMPAHAITFSPDGATLYMAGTEYEPGTVNVVNTSRVVALDIATGAQTVVLEATEEISHVFTGRVEVSDDTADAAAPGPLLLVDLQIGQGSIRPLQIRPVDPVTMLETPSAAPIVLGHYWQHVFSPDGSMLAALTFPTQTGGGGSLRLFDLEPWREVIEPVPLDGPAGNLTFSDDGEAIFWVRGDYVEGSYVLLRYDRASGAVSVVATFPEQFVPHEIRSLKGGLQVAVYGVPTDGGNLAVGKPRAILVDVATGAFQTDIVLEEVRAWQIRDESEHEDAYPVRIYQPGIAWDSERGLLYVVHADEDVITVVDLERGTTEATPFEPQQSLSERLLDWIAPPALASPVPWTNRSALLSDDGERLFIAGSVDRWRKVPGTRWNEGWTETMTWSGLQVIDTGNLSEAREVDLPVVSDMRLSPDGKTLIVGTYVPGQRENGELLRTEQRIIGLSADDLSEVGSVEMSGSYTIEGFSTDGRTLYVNRQWFEGETPHVDLIALDMETWTTKVVRTFPEAWYVELVARE